MTAPLTYQQRNALAGNPAIAPLAKGALTYTPGKPQFSSLAASILGNTGTSADGFDALFASVADIIDPEITSVTVLDGILLGLGFVPGALDAVTFSPIADQYSAFAKAGDLNLEGLDGTQPGGGGGGPGGGTGNGKPPLPHPPGWPRANPHKIPWPGGSSGAPGGAQPGESNT